MQLKVTLEHREPKDYVSPALFSSMKRRIIIVLGGLIFQELPANI